MKTKKRKLLLLLCGLSLAFIVNSQTPTNDLNWNTTNLIFFDDFIGNLNTTNWRVYDSGSEPTWQWPDNQGRYREYFNPNFVLPNTPATGRLSLKAENRTPVLPHNVGPQWNVGGITTGTGGTNGYYNYGYFEIKWKLPPSVNGRWLSFWLVGAPGEIDILENFDGLTNYQISTNIHNNNNTTYNLATVPTDIYDQSTDIKIGVEWLPKMCVFYLNDVPYREVLYEDIVPIGNPNGLAILITPGISDSIDPTYLSTPNYTEVDWVRICSLKPKENVSKIIANISDYNTYVFNPTMKNSIKFNSGIGITVNNGQHLTLRARDYIEINGDFTIAAGGECTIICHNEN
jgi:beta-glucanase (GH16 family)